jgi:hypothetical protein
MDENTESEVIQPAEAPVVEEEDVIAKKDAEIARLAEERDNYKKVALKRLGKLPADNEFLGDDGTNLNTLIEDQVKTQLLDQEIARKQAEREAEIRRITKENSELRLALKNRPQTSSGGDSGTSAEVKDNVFSEAQLLELRKRAEKLKADPEKFIENAKSNLSKRR